MGIPLLPTHVWSHRSAANTSVTIIACLVSVASLFCLDQLCRDEEMQKLSECCIKLGFISSVLMTLLPSQARAAHKWSLTSHTQGQPGYLPESKNLKSLDFYLKTFTLIVTHRPVLIINYVFLFFSVIQFWRLTNITAEAQYLY